MSSVLDYSKGSMNLCIQENINFPQNQEYLYPFFLTCWLTKYLRGPEDKKNSKVACVTIDLLPRVSTNKTDCHDIMKYC